MEKYRNYVIPAVIVVLIIAVFAIQASRSDNQPEAPEQQTENQPIDGQSGQNGSPEQGQTPETGSPDLDGNVVASGVLANSDNLSRGNLMLAESNLGRIYIATSRDFSSLIGKNVTMVADGAVESFRFLGFREAGSTPPPAMTPDQGQGNSPVTATGRLENSDLPDRGNYVIVSDVGRIYLQSKRDYSAWVGTSVKLTAQGTINSFTQALLTK